MKLKVKHQKNYSKTFPEEEIKIRKILAMKKNLI